MDKIIISPSPHIHSDESVKKLMYGVIIALTPVLAASLWFFGVGALLVTAVSVCSCLIFEYLIQKFLLKKPTTISDGSAIITGLLLAFNLPSNLPIWIVIIGALVAIGIGKMTFGGLGNNPFNPALVGRVFLLISFPAQMTTWPLPIASRTSLFVDAQTGATPLSLLKSGVAQHHSMSQIMEGIPDWMDLFLGNIGGSAGEVAAFAILIGFVFLLIRKIITWHIPISILATVLVFTAILNFANPESYANPMFHLLSGGLLLGAIFMATDYATSPMTKPGMLVYGVGIGVITVLIRTFGSYPEGVSFAILIMNAFVPLINKYVRPKRYGA